MGRIQLKQETSFISAKDPGLSQKLDGVAVVSDAKLRAR